MKRDGHNGAGSAASTRRCIRAEHVLVVYRIYNFLLEIERCYIMHKLRVETQAVVSAPREPGRFNLADSVVILVLTTCCLRFRTHSYPRIIVREVHSYHRKSASRGLNIYRSTLITIPIPPASSSSPRPPDNPTTTHPSLILQFYAVVLAPPLINIASNTVLRLALHSL